MPTRNIYLSRELDDAVRLHEVPVSEVCQRALWRELNVRGWLGVGHLIDGQLQLPNTGGGNVRQGRNRGRNIN